MSYKGKASVIMSRFSGGERDTGIHVTVKDDKSGCRILELWFTLEEFAKAITASFGEADLAFYRDCPVGKVRENKTMVVPFNSYSRDPEDKAAALKPFETDGWKGSQNDLGNHHRSVGDGAYRVNFSRYVDEGIPKEAT